MITRAISHEARLPLLAHVDELRMRLIVSAVVLAVAFAFAFWQNHAVLNVLNRPLASATSATLKRSHGPLADVARTQHAVRVALNRQRVAFEQLARASTARPPAERRALTAAADATRPAAAPPARGAPARPAKPDAGAVPMPPAELSGRQPVTLGIGEPFGQTVTVSA